MAAAVVAAACGAAGCGGADAAPRPEHPLAATSRACLGLDPRPLARVPLPTELLPARAILLGGQRRGRETYAAALVDAGLAATHDGIVARAPAAGWTVEREELEAKDAEVYLRRGTTRLTVQLYRAGRCANATSAQFATVG
jgi:hypothetical protein